MFHSGSFSKAAPAKLLEFTTFMNMQDIGKKIQARREYMGLTQGEVGEFFGFNAPAVSKWESGTSEISATNLIRLAQILRVPPAWFFDPGFDESDVQVQDLIAAFRELSPQLQALVVRHVTGLLAATRVPTEPNLTLLKIP